MFNRPTKTPSIPAKLISILSVDQLLHEKNRHELITDLAQLSAFEPTLFTTTCQRLIANLTNRCQRLPESTLYFGQLGGFLDHSLQRTHAAMHLFRQYLITNPQDSLSLTQQLWWYALFSASLLKGVGRLCVEYQLERYSPKGQRLTLCEPLLESLGQVGQYYHFEFKSPLDLAFRHRLTLILARQLMPENGFEWLVSHPKVLAAWLALLEEDQEGSGALGAILDRADSIAIQNELHHLLSQMSPARPERRISISSFIDHTPEMHQDKEQLAALEFIQWLQQALEKGKFILNKPPIMYIPAGLIILPEAFELFMRENSHYKNWRSIRRNLMSLPLYPADQAQASLTPHAQQEGVLMPGHLLVPEKMPQTTATKLALAAYPFQLSAAGLWNEPASPSVLINPVNKNPYG